MKMFDMETPLSLGPPGSFPEEGTSNLTPGR